MTAFHKLAREEPLGRYRLIARLGRGGMAEVFLARLIGAGGFEKLVAIKRMLPMLSDDPAFVAMFLREGRIAAQLDHPNICHVYELDDADGTLYLAMEFLRGLPWSEIIPAVPDQPRQQLARFAVGAIVQACEGLHHAHTAIGVDGQPRSVVHRDVSPSNLFVTHDGIVKLLDFGVSTVLTDATGTGVGRKGKLPYMAPEQLRGEPVDVTADIFALAVVTWEAFAGRALFDRSSDYHTMMAVHEAAIPALPGDDPVTARLDAVLRRALARDRTLRHASARELAHDLRQAIAQYGEPMASSEIQAHVATWLGPSLARRGRELAELIAQRPLPDDAIGEQTAVHTPAHASGARLRDASVVVDHDLVGAEAPTEPVSALTADLTLAPTFEPPADAWRRAPRLWPPSRRTGPLLVVLGIAAIAVVTTWAFLQEDAAPSAATSVAGDPPADAARGSVADPATGVARSTADPPPTAATDAPTQPGGAGNPEPSAPRSPPRARSSSSDPVALFERGDYTSVVQACSARISVDLVRVCVLAACQQRNAGKAVQWWRSARTSAERDQLAASCRKLSKGAIALGPSLDCARNPLDCR